MAIGSPFFNPVFQFVDPNGVPYAGGSLAFYATGTNTPLATYADIGLTIPNPNPVPLNSSGFPGTSIFLQALEYRAVLSDVNGIQIWTADPIFSGGNFTSTVVTEGTGSIGFQAINTSANGQTWGWYSNADGSFTAVNGTTAFTAISVSAAGLVGVENSFAVSSLGDALVSLTSTSANGNEWALQSNTDGSFALVDYTTALFPLTFQSSGTAVAGYAWTFDSGITVLGLGQFNNGLYVEAGQLTVNGTTDCVGILDVNGLATMDGGLILNAGALTVNSSAGFASIVTFTGGTNPAVSAAGNIGFGMINTTASTGHAWEVVSQPNGALAFIDNTLALSRGYFDLHGTLYLTAGPVSGTDGSTFGILTTSGASTATGTYNFGLSVAQGVVALTYAAISDSRLKWDVEEITADEAWAYVMAGRPVRYSMAHGKRLAGFLAQDDIKRGAGRGDAIFAALAPDLEEHTDADGFVSPAGTQLSRNYDHDIAYLTRAIQDLRAIVDSQMEIIAALQQGTHHARP